MLSLISTNMCDDIVDGFTHPIHPISADPVMVILDLNHATHHARCLALKKRKKGKLTILLPSEKIG
jgi:hypothetical protein